MVIALKKKNCTTVLSTAIFSQKNRIFAIEFNFRDDGKPKNRFGF